MESFFSSVKSELRDRFDSCGEAKMELFDYIEVFTTSVSASEEDRTNGDHLTAHLH